MNARTLVAILTLAVLILSGAVSKQPSRPSVATTQGISR